MYKLYQSNSEMYYVKEIVRYASVSEYLVQITSILNFWILYGNHL